MSRCAGCGRVRANERRWHRWCGWAMEQKGREPWWWKHRIVCLGWYDCPADFAPAGNPMTWYERRCYQRVGGEGDGGR